jgi:hypothetical protein
MFTIIFIAKIPLQFQIKQEVQGGGGGVSPWTPYQVSALDLLGT